MGKKRGAVIRAKKRANEAAAELLEQTIDNEENARFEAKEDDELFVIDTTPDPSKASLVTSKKNPKRKQESTLNLKQTKKNRISENEERQIKKILSKHSAEEVRSLAIGNEQRLKQRKRSKRIAGSAKANFDLWGDIDTKEETGDKQIVPVRTGVAAAAGTAPIEFKAVSRSSLRKDIQQPAELSNKQLKFRAAGKEKARKSIQIELAQPGQSYRPDKEQHQDVIGEALSIELRRKEALEYQEQPIGGGGMSKATLALLVGSSDEESSDEEDEDDTETMSNKPLKRREKLTRAQRNKQKRVKALQVALEERKRVKQLLHSLHDTKKINKEIRKQEAERITRREQINALKEEEKSKPLGINILEKLSERDPINAPSLPVALTEELKDGALRTVKPKGSLLTDRLESMISRKMANRKSIETKKIIQGKKRRMKSGKGREYLLA